MPSHPSQNHPQASPAAYPAYRTSTYVYPGRTALSAGIFGTVVAGSAALAENLHKVQDKQMSAQEAFADSLAKGAGAGVATAAATAVATAVGGRGILSFALMAATATGVGYMINSMGKSISEKVVSTTAKSSK